MDRQIVTFLPFTRHPPKQTNLICLPPPKIYYQNLPNNTISTEGLGGGAVRKKYSAVFFLNLRFLQEPSSGAEIRLHTKHLPLYMYSESKNLPG